MVLLITIPRETQTARAAKRQEAIHLLRHEPAPIPAGPQAGFEHLITKPRFGVENHDDPVGRLVYLVLGPVGGLRSKRRTTSRRSRRGEMAKRKVAYESRLILFLDFLVF